VEGHEKIEIIGGRHPLVEQIGDFVPNSTTFEGNEKIVILTGPNASGKSIYLKQVKWKKSMAEASLQKVVV
jgi:DNA mismatch repair ATPase MutS